MSPDKNSPNRVRKLVNDLTVEDARHLLRNEGGDLTAQELVTQGLSILAVSATCAYAIWQGNVTAWHLALPSLAQYVALLLAVPALYLVRPHPGLRKDAMNSLRLLAGIVVAIAIATAVRAMYLQTSWRNQFTSDLALCWRWVIDADMHWPMLLAAVGLAMALPGRVRNLHEYGPPFVSVGLGCAMRLVVLIPGCFLLPWALGSSTRMVWFLWALLLAAEILALGTHWDIQRRLRKLDGASQA